MFLDSAWLPSNSWSPFHVTYSQTEKGTGTGKGACPHIGRSLRVATRSNPLVARSTALLFSRRCLRCSPSYSDLKFALFLLLRMLTIGFDGEHAQRQKRREFQIAIHRKHRRSAVLRATRGFERVATRSDRPIWGHAPLPVP